MRNSDNLIKKKNVLERVAFPLLIAVGIPAVIFIKFLEPSYSAYRFAKEESSQAAKKVELLKKQFVAKGESGTATGKEKPDIYLLNYLDKLTAKADLKLKSFQDSGAGAAKGIASFQMRFTCNVNTFARFLSLCEGSFPPLSIGNWRVNSLAGGSFSGMRQLEGTATVTFLAAGAGVEPAIADLSKFKGHWRDVFSEMPAEVPKKKEPEPEPEEEKEPDPVIKWSLTAQMSDGESDVIIVTNSVTRKRANVDLKKAGASIVVNGETVSIKAGENTFDWVLGEAIEQDKLPKELLSIINSASPPQASGDSSDEEE